MVATSPLINATIGVRRSLLRHAAATMLLLGGVTPCAVAADVSFDAPFTAIQTALGPRSLAVADLDHDGDLDLVSCGASDNAIDVHLGRGDGTYLPRVAFPAGGAPQGVALADLNGDGWLDAITANLASSVSVLLGAAGGTFGSKTDYATGPTNSNSTRRNVVAADFDRDGRLDLMVANPNATFSLLRGHGDGTFAAATSVPAGGNFVAAADLDGDGSLDIAFGAFGAIGVRLGHGDGTFGAEIDASVTSARRFAFADLDSDGRLDLVAGSPNASNIELPGSIAVLHGNGNGSFGAAVYYPAAPNVYSIAIGDLDADGRLDVVGSTLLEGGGVLSVLRGRGDGTFEPERQLAASALLGVPALADLDADGRIDIATPSYYSSTILLHHGNGDATFGVTRAFPIGLSSKGLELADVDDDGNLDAVTVVGSYSGPDSTAVYLGDGHGRFGAPIISLLDLGSGYTELEDLNGDSRLDFVTTGPDSTVQVSLGNGDRTFGPATSWVVGREPYSLEAGDWNEDGRPDLVVSNYGIPYSVPPDSGRTISLLLGNGDGTFQPRSDFVAGALPNQIFGADFDRDGHQDVLVGIAWDGFAILFGHGDGTFSSPVVHQPASGTSPNAVGDLDADGSADVVLQHSGSQGAKNVMVQLGAGDGSFVTAWDAPVMYSFFSTPVSGIQDFDLDGHPDLLLDPVYNTAAILRGHGDGTFEVPEIRFGTGNGYGFAVTGDVDRDGRPDLVTANSGLIGNSQQARVAADLVVLLNTTPGGPTGVAPAPNVNALSLSALHPNPARDLPPIQFTLAARAPATLELFDLSGRRLRSREVGSLSPGSHRVSFPGARLDPGLYFVRLTQGTERRSARVVVLH
jgi:hypothetical protein